jgi:replicative DNA helicase
MIDEKLDIGPRRECAIIGGLIRWQDIIWTVECKDSDFSDRRTRAAFQAILSLENDKQRDERINELDIEEKAKNAGVNYLWLAECISLPANSQEVLSHAKYIREKAKEREIRKLGYDLYKSKLEGYELLEHAEREVSSIAAQIEMSGGAVTSAEAARAIMLGLEGDGDVRLSTGEWEWDRFGECDLGDMIIIGGATSMGKSQLLSWLRRGYVAKGERVAVVTTESKWRKVGRRDLSLLSGVNSRKMRSGGNLTRDELEALAEAAREYSQWPLWLNDQLYDIDDILRWFRFMRERHGVTVFQVDHLQEMHARAQKGSPREVMNYILAQYSAFAHEKQGVYAQAVSQLNRRADREGKLPRMSDLQESGRIEQTAQVVVLLHRPAYYDGKADKEELKLLFAKVRDGEIGIRDWMWNNNLGQIVGPKRINPETQNWASVGP